MPKIIYCQFEEKSNVPSYLKTETHIRTETADNKDDNELIEISGDYIIETDDGETYGVERKTLLDLYESIITKNASGKKRIEEQLRRLKAKYGRNAILLIEWGGFPINVLKGIFAYMDWVYKKKLSYRNATQIIIQSIFTFLSECSLNIVIFLSKDKKHTAYLLDRLASRGKTFFKELV